MNELFSLKDKMAIATGGTGVLGGAIAHGLAAVGATVGILGRRAEKATDAAAQIEATDGAAFPLPPDVLDRDSLLAARTEILGRHGRIDILINCAGGNLPKATIFGDLTFFNMTQEAFEQVIALNLTGTVLPGQVFGEQMARQGSGIIINISSMTAQKPLTRVLGYGNVKAAVDNYTKWLAVELAQK